MTRKFKKQREYHETAGTYPGEGWTFFRNVPPNALEIENVCAAATRQVDKDPARVTVVDNAFQSCGLECRCYSSVWVWKDKIMGCKINREKIVKNLMRSVAEKFKLDFEALQLGEFITQELADRIIKHADAYLAVEMTEGFVVELLQKISGDAICPVALLVSVPEAIFKTGQIETGTIVYN